MTELGRKRTVYAPEIRQRAEEMFQQGYGYKKTAAVMGIPALTVRDWRRKWAKGTLTVPSNTLTPSEKRRITCLTKRGFTITGVAKLLGRSYSTVKAYLMKTSEL